MLALKLCMQALNKYLFYTCLYLCAGASPGLLFDWAIPLMTAYATDGAAPDEGAAYWALSALQHGLPGCDNKALTRYGNALLEACQRLLEADTLSEHLLPPLLAVIAQVPHLCHFVEICQSLPTGAMVYGERSRAAFLQ